MNWEKQMGKGHLDRLGEVAIVIGKDVYTRAEYARMQCTRTIVAARNLSEVLMRFKPRNVQELAERITLDHLLDSPGVGIATIDVWMHILAYNGINPSRWLDRKVMVTTVYAKHRNRRRKRKTQKKS